MAMESTGSSSSGSSGSAMQGPCQSKQAKAVWFGQRMWCAQAAHTHVHTCAVPAAHLHGSVKKLLLVLRLSLTCCPLSCLALLPCVLLYGVSLHTLCLSIRHGCPAADWQWCRTDVGRREAHTANCHSLRWLWLLSSKNGKQQVQGVKQRTCWRPHSQLACERVLPC